jgi:hypothetical protein
MNPASAANGHLKEEVMRVSATLVVALICDDPLAG